MNKAMKTMNNTIKIQLATYDGTDKTLPREYETVLVSGVEGCSAYRVGDTWVMHNSACGFRHIQKGDRWGYLPAIKEASDD